MSQLPPCVGCGAPLNCENLDPFDLYSLEGDNFPFVGNCPPGYDCSATNELRMVCCDQELIASIPSGSTSAQRRAITQKLWSQCALLLDFCGSTIPPEPLAIVSDPPITLFYNRPQTCKKLCPDGVTEFTYTTQAGLYLARTQLLADTSAYEFACEQVALNECPPCRAIELTALPSSLCLATNYVLSISAIGDTVAQPPATNIWTLVSGTIPTGMTMFSGTIAGPLVISGIPSAGGVFNFTVKIQVSPTCFKTGDYSLTVRGITTADPLPDATPDVPYTTTLTKTGFGTVVWSIANGTLPTGLTLDPNTGIISGTPTVIGDFTFTVSITGGGNTCAKVFHLAVFAYSGKRINAWKQWCGYTDLRNTYNGNSENTPPPSSVCGGDCQCNIRWRTMTVHEVWDSTYLGDPGPGPNSGSNDTYVYQYQRYNCDSGPALISETHTGLQIGDAYSQAVGAICAAGCGIPSGGSINPVSQPLVWTVSINTDISYRVDIAFQVNGTEAIYTGYREVTLSDPYSIQDLQTDLQALWAAVTTDDYAWEDDVFTIDVTYRAAQERIVQYCQSQPAVVPSNGQIRDIFAVSKCAFYDQPIVPPLFSINDPRFNYHAAMLFAATSVTPSPFPCINLVKTIFRYRGLYCRYNFGKRLPLVNPCTLADCDPATCDPAWDVSTVTPTLQTTLTPFTILPITGTPPYTYNAGFRSITQSCELLEWWKLEEPDLDPRLGQVLVGTELSPQESGGGVVNSTPAKILDGTRMETPGSSEIESLNSSLLPAFGYNPGNNVSGRTVTGWFKILSPNSDTTLDEITFGLTSPGNSFSLVITGGNATAEVIGGVVVGTATNPFTPVVDTWYFFRFFLNSITNEIGFQINNGIIYTAAVTGGAVPVTASNQFIIDFKGKLGVETSVIVLDELAIFATNLSDDSITFLYNSGAGRTFPFYT